jgi:hypothetical protein
VVSSTLRPLYPQVNSPLRAVLDTVVKRKIPLPRREWNPITPIIQPIA